MSNYIKKYGTGNISIDLPYNSHIHELPLLYFKDHKNSVNISIVYNNELKEEYSNNNLFNINYGFKLNIQKKLLFTNGVPEKYINESGKIIDLLHKGQVFLFNDESKRVLRATTSGYEVENFDFSKEIFNANGDLVTLYDKYGDVYLSYTYDGAFLKTINYNNKTVTFSYSSNKLSSIAYGGTTTTFVYGTNLITINHYSSVKYTLNTSNTPSYVVTATGIEGTTTITYQQKCLYIDNKIEIQSLINNTEIEKLVYEFPLYESPANYMIQNFRSVIITNKKGVKNKIQFGGEKPMYSFELLTDNNSDLGFVNNCYPSSVNIYNTIDYVQSNKVVDTFKLSDGIVIKRVGHEYSMDSASYYALDGYYLLTGWAKSTDINKTNTLIRLSNNTVSNLLSFNTSLTYNEWNFFAYKFKLEGTTIFVRPTFDKVEYEDLRLTFVETSKNEEQQVPDEIKRKKQLINHNILLRNSDSKIFELYELPFYYIKNGDVNIIYDVTFNDILKYKLLCKKNGSCNYIYTNDLQDIIEDISEFGVFCDNTYQNIDLFHLGNQYYKGGKLYYNYTNIDTSSPTVSTENYLYRKDPTGNTRCSYSYLNQYFDTTLENSDNITINYTRNKGLLVRKKITNYSNIHITYTNQLITVKDDYSTENKIIKYHLDSVWGNVYKIEYGDGYTITDTLDDDKSHVLQKKFSKLTEDTIHDYNYSKGFLSALTNDTLNYEFEYDVDKLKKVKKNSSVIEEYEHTDTTTTCYYPIKNSPIYSDVYRFDKYDRLTKIDNQLENEYHFFPSFDTSGNLTYNDAKRTHNDFLATTTDLITSEKSRYEYNNSGKLVSKEVGSSINYSNKISKENYKYDLANRLTEKEFIYNMTTSDKVKDTIEYCHNENDNVIDNRVRVSKYYINGTEVGKVENTFDSLKRLTKESFTVGTNLFEKDYTYSYEKIVEENIEDIVNRKYTYDVYDRISMIQEGNKLIYYTYDIYGRLIKEDNQLLDKTTVYAYNEIGNIVSKTIYPYKNLNSVLSTINYTYDSTYKDRLVTYNGMSIPYDTLSCPTKLDDYNVTWTKGKLTRLSKGTRQTGLESYNYSYNGYGQRNTKTYSRMEGTSGLNPIEVGEVTEYVKKYKYDESGRLINEASTISYYSVGNSTENIEYIYNLNQIIGFKYTRGSQTNVYNFERNLFGDVVGIYDESGNLKVKYIYDAYGNCTISNETTDQSLARVNPIRYRGYYYDVETGLFWISSRYYNPEWGRWISPDDIEYLDPESVNGLNLYCYCGNDPTSIANYTFANNSFDVNNPMFIGNTFNESLTSNSKKTKWFLGWYRGVPVFKAPFALDGRPYSFWGIFLAGEDYKKFMENPNIITETLNHEWGHTRQLLLLGIGDYFNMIAIPSILDLGPGLYYNKPWEITADMFGGVIRSDHTKIAKQIGVAYLGAAEFLSNTIVKPMLFPIYSSAAALLDGIIPGLGTTLLTIIYTS